MVRWQSSHVETSASFDDRVHMIGPVGVANCGQNSETPTVLAWHDAFSDADRARDLEFYSMLLATLEGDAMNQLLVLPRGNGLEWFGRPSQRHSPKTLGHRRVRLDQILNLVIDGGFAANVTRGDTKF